MDNGVKADLADAAARVAQAKEVKMQSAKRLLRLGVTIKEISRRLKMDHMMVSELSKSIKPYTGE